MVDPQHGRDVVPQWSGEEYARQSGHHRAADDWFLARHSPTDHDVVVDLGCGSGEFTARLASLVPGGRVIGVDPDASMLAAARRHAAANLELLQAGAEELDRVLPHGSADLVVSRSMLHWVPVDRYPRVFEAVRNVLRPGGVFHSESAAVGNVAAVTALLDSVSTEHGLPLVDAFPDPGQVLELLERAGLDLPTEGVRSVAQRRAFTRDELVGLLRTQASVALRRHAAAGEAGPLVEEVVSRVEQLRRHDGSYDQTFVRLEIFARRPA